MTKLNMFKKIFSILVASLLLVNTAQAQVVAFPNRGGTGTSSAPTYGQILVGTTNGVYQTQATSTLGLPTFSGNNIYTGQNTFTISTTSAATTTNFTAFKTIIVPAVTSTSTTLLSSFAGSVVIGSNFNPSGGTLAVNGSIYQIGTFSHFGTTASPTPCNTFGATCLELIGADNSAGGVGIQVQNITSGNNSYAYINLLNDNFASNTSNFGGFFLNSSVHTDGEFGPGNITPNLFTMQNTMGDIALMASSTTFGTNSNIKFYTQGVALSNLRGIIDQNGNWGIGTSTPYVKLAVAGDIVSATVSATSTTATSSLQNTSVNQLKVGSLGGALVSTNGFVTATNLGTDQILVGTASGFTTATANTANGWVKLDANGNISGYSVIPRTSSTTDISTTVLDEGEIAVATGTPNVIDTIPTLRFGDGHTAGGIIVNPWDYSTTTGNIAYFLGDVGIGTTTALAPLWVRKTSAANNIERVLTGNDVAVFENSSGHGSSSNIDIISSEGGGSKAQIFFIGKTDTLPYQSGVISYDQAADYMEIVAGGATSTTFLANGNVGMGTSSPYARLSVVGQVVGNYFNATSTTATSTFPQLSTTELAATTICLTGDICRTTWPTSGGGGGSGNVATSTSETAGQLAYWTSNSATPATLGKVATTSINCTGFISCTGFSALGSASTIGVTGQLAIASGGTALSAVGASSTVLTTNGSVNAYQKITVNAFASTNVSQWTNDSGYQPFSFTPTNSFGAVANSTSTQILFTQGISASSTVTFGNAGLNPFWWDSSQGFLGLGTTSPDKALTVNGDIDFAKNLVGGTRIIRPATNTQNDAFGGTSILLSGANTTCFIAGTQITMADGSHKNIEDIQIGDTVRSFDENTKQIVTSSVDKLFHHPTADMTGDYYLVIKTTGGTTMNVTYNHRIYSAGNWVDAGNLIVGSPLLNDQNQPDFVASIGRVQGKYPSYNFEVVKYHLYYASGILVHNAKGITALPPGNTTITAGSSGNASANSGAQAGSVFIYPGLADTSSAGPYVATTSVVILANTGIKAQGNVGVGTSTPYSRLSVWGDTTDTKPFVEFTNSASTTVFTALGNGNVGIGTKTPGQKLEVNGGIGFTGFTAVITGSFFGTGGVGVTLGDGSTLQYTTASVIGTSDLFHQGSPNNANAYFDIEAASGKGLVLDTINAGQKIVFAPQRTQRAWMADTGYMGYGSSTPFAALSVSATAQQAGSTQLFDVASTTNATLFNVLGNGNVGVGTTSPWQTFSVQGTVAMNGLTAFATGDSALCLRAGGLVTFDSGVSSCIVSSRAVKHDIQNTATKDAVDRVLQLNPVSFEYNGTNKPDLGLIAEDVAAIDPRYAQYSDKTNKPAAINWSAITSDAIKTIQSQNDKINALEEKVSSLDSSVKKIENFMCPIP